MKLSKILSAGLVALSLGVSASAAHATAYVMDIALSATPGNTTFFSNPAAGLSLRSRGWFLGGLYTPFNVISGDTILVNLSFSGPVSIIDNNSAFSMGNIQAIGINFQNAVNHPGFTETLSTTISLTGTSGDFVGNPAVNLQTGTAGNEGVGAGSGPGGVNLTNSIMSFTGVTFFVDVLSIPSQSAPFTLGTFTIGDELNPVPAPGALALLGLGLFGFGGLRRKAKAA